MRILNIPEITVPATTTAPAAPALDPERVEALEHVAKSILEKIQGLEERLQALEKTQRAPAPASVPTPEPPVKNIPLSVVSVDSEAVKKQLMDKMWKYLNDDQPRKAV